jgi:hypothetical protein
MTEQSPSPTELVQALQVSEASLPAGQYAVVEQLGHARFVGRFEQVEAFGAQFLKIEPLFGDWLLPPVLLGGASLYRFTPCTPSTAWNLRARYRHELPSCVHPQIVDDPEPVFAPAFLGYDDGGEQ